ncbi:MAG: GEVED domain-containing protein [Flavobacteriaceae bacterium]|nr:GEVED domain-containing protein [Flavobacteriaceae bacterium]
MKRLLFALLCVPFITMAQEGCTSGSAWPTTAFTPICDATPQIITSGGWAGEYSPVNVVEGETYTFSSSRATDFITIADASGETVYSTGTGSVEYTATVSEELRFYLHLNSECESQSQDRVRSVQCGSEPTEIPHCPQITSPVNGANDVNYTGNVLLTWSPPTTGGLVSAFKIYIDTTNGTNFLGSTAGDAVWATITGLEENTTYYWTITAENAAGESMDCEVFSFTTISNPFPPYCGPLTFTYLTEPITQVIFAGIENVTEALGSNSVPHESFVHLTAQVQPGQTYPITMAGNTEGAHNNYFAVYIDWNQDDDFDDAGEKYFIDGSVSIFNSNGTDGVSVTANITVPANAPEGTTRMRIKKDYGNYQTPDQFDDPCFGGLYGQIEDYSLHVGTLSVNDITAKTQIQLFPNPVSDVLKIKGDEVKMLQIYDMSRKKLVHRANSNEINVSSLLPGVYIIQMTNADGKKTSKQFIKK